MFVPPTFAEADENEIRRLISEHPLALIAYSVGGAVDAQHIPVIFDGQNRLIGHVAANNDMCSSLQSGSEVLLVFSGQDSYISPNWYPSKQIHHRHVPTWNYQSVHVRGTLNYLTDPKAALGVVGMLTKHFERRVNGSEGWKIADAPRDYMADLLTQLTPFEVDVRHISAQSKLSQNREKADHDSVRNQMLEADKLELACRMSSCIKES